MTITYELDLASFEAWSGGKDTLNRVINEGKVSTLEAILEDCYPEGMTETQLNDILWFEEEWIFEMCGIRSESVIREELEEAQEELSELEEEWNDAVAEEVEEINSNREMVGMNELEDYEITLLASKIWKEEFSERGVEIRERIEELEEELENI